MTTYQVGAHTTAPTSLVLDILHTRANWLGDFLTLATHRAGVQSVVIRSSPPPWFRLGAVDADGRSGGTAQIIWHPHLGDELFDQFKGFVIVLPSSDGTILRLEGQTVGGPPERNLATLSAVLDLIATALSAATCPSDSR